jgi:hypothetical protein
LPLVVPPSSQNAKQFLSKTPERDAAGYSGPIVLAMDLFVGSRGDRGFVKKNVLVSPPARGGPATNGVRVQWRQGNPETYVCGCGDAARNPGTMYSSMRL